MITITKINDIINWELLIGEKSNKKSNISYIITSYDKINNMLNIAEIRNDGSKETNVISLYDEDKSKSILLEYGFEVNIVNKFNFTESSKNKLQGFLQAGMNYLYYKDDMFKVDDLVPVDFLNEEEISYLKNIFVEDNKILLYDIIKMI